MGPGEFPGSRGHTDGRSEKDLSRGRGAHREDLEEGWDFDWRKLGRRTPA